MHRTISLRVTLVGALLLTVSRCLAQSAPVEGTLSLSDHTYKLAYAVSFETKTSDFELITLLASNRPIATDKLKAALRADGNDQNFSLDQPYLKIVFYKDGRIANVNGWADNSSFSSGGDSLKGELTLDGNRITGKAELAPKADSIVKRSFAIRFDLPLGLDGAAPAKPKRSGAVKPTVTGKFTGNGKAAKLAFVSARAREPFDDKPGILLIFSERDHSKDPRPDITAAFGNFGSALLISVFEDGGIFGCEVAHANHAKKPFSSIGTIRMDDFDLGDNFVEGHLTTDGEKDALDQKWDVDLKFAAPLPTRPKAPATAQSTEKKKVPAPAPVTKPQVAALNVHDLALPKSMTDVQYKEIVEQMTFKSPAKVQSLAAELTKNLTAQGWTADDDDLITPKSAILNRKRGEATLTIMLKPDEAGSQATVFATGLNWDEK